MKTGKKKFNIVCSGTPAAGKFLYLRVFLSLFLQIITKKSNYRKIQNRKKNVKEKLVYKKIQYTCG